MIYRDGKTSGTTEYYNVYMRTMVVKTYTTFLLTVATLWVALITPNTGILYQALLSFYQEDGTNTGHPIRVFNNTARNTQQWCRIN